MVNIKISLLLAIVLSTVLTLTTSAQEIAGRWRGNLVVPTGKLRLVFDIQQNGTQYCATMDSPDQGAKGIPATRVSVVNAHITIEISNLNILYKGTVQGNEIKGTFTQNGLSFSMNLTPGEATIKINRPQEPIDPVPYRSEDVTFQNTKAGITLAGTLTLPKTGSNFPVVILISGSGPQNRDEEIANHKPFWIIADYLTRNGIAVLRFDDRGTAKSTGNFSTATTVDFAEDVQSAMTYLKERKEINKRKIGLIGHSEGGIIAPMVATSSKDINFIVLLAAPGVKSDQLMLLQKRTIEQQSGINPIEIDKSQTIFAGAYNIITSRTVNSAKLKDSVYTYFKKAFKNTLPQPQLSALTSQLVSPWFIYFLRFDPSVYLSKVKCSVLALNGTKDLQVSSKQNLPVIESILKTSENNNVTTVEFKNLNHLFQECSTGLPQEYSTIEQTFSPKVLETIKNWILKQVK